GRLQSDVCCVVRDDLIKPVMESRLPVVAKPLRLEISRVFSATLFRSLKTAIKPLVELVAAPSLEPFPLPYVSGKCLRILEPIPEQLLVRTLDRDRHKVWFPFGSLL